MKGFAYAHFITKQNSSELLVAEENTLLLEPIEFRLDTWRKTAENLSDGLARVEFTAVMEYLVYHLHFWVGVEFKRNRCLFDLLDKRRRLHHLDVLLGAEPFQFLNRLHASEVVDGNTPDLGFVVIIGSIHLFYGSFHFIAVKSNHGNAKFEV